MKSKPLLVALVIGSCWVLAMRLFLPGVFNSSVYHLCFGGIPDSGWQFATDLIYGYGGLIVSVLIVLAPPLLIVRAFWKAGWRA